MNTAIADSKRQKTIASITVLVVVTIMVLGVKVLTPKTGAAKTPVGTLKPSAVGQSLQSPASFTTAPSAPSTGPANSQVYKDGTYQATGDYVSPGGPESLQLNITLKDDIVMATSAESGANDPTAAQFQDDFIQGYKTFVVGKNVNDIQLSNVSGSSLTPQGFNDALAQIKSQAKAS